MRTTRVEQEGANQEMQHLMALDFVAAFCST